MGSKMCICSLVGPGRHIVTGGGGAAVPCVCPDDDGGYRHQTRGLLWPGQGRGQDDRQVLQTL